MEPSAFLLLTLCLLPFTAAQLSRGRLLQSYQWKTEAWGRCLGNVCGLGGVQRRAVWCEHSDGSNASPSDCGTEDAPPSEQACYRVCLQDRAFFEWQISDWQPCRQNNNPDLAAVDDITSCGPSSFGLQERIVACTEIGTSFVQANEDGSVADYICEQFTAKPATVQECITPCAQDCVVTSFTAWSQCSKSCGNGTQFRSRRIVIPSSNGGENCPALSESRLCVEEPVCAQEELFTFSPRVTTWDACQGSGGAGRARPNEPTISTQSRQVGCQRSDGKNVRTSLCFRDHTYIQPPQHQVCVVPVACQVSGWSEWSSCSDPCSSSRVGHSVRQRNVLTVPEGEGERCPELVQKRTCFYDVTQCPRGRYVWRTSDWSACGILPDSSGGSTTGNDRDRGGEAEGRSCGGGLATREVFCAHSNDSDSTPLADKLCDPGARPGTTTDCHVPCPSACRVGPWTSWGPCISFDCDIMGTKKAKGHTHRTREIVAPEEHGGTKCPHLSEHAPCNIQRCFRWEVEETTCQPNDAQTMCGQGMMTVNIQCLNSQELPVEDESLCAALGHKPNTEQDCMAPCPSDCVIGQWGAWSECSETCEGTSGRGGTQMRYRTILAQHGPGGEECPEQSELVESRACNHHSCTLFGWLTTEWGECSPSSDNPDQAFSPDEMGSCGVGSQVRNVSCSRVNPAKVAPDKRCFAPARPPNSRPCEVQCILDCIVSDFGDWTPCPSTCSSTGSLATQERRRYVLQQPQNGGTECPTLLLEERTCNKPDSCYSYSWQASAWGDCSLTGVPVITRGGVEELCGDGLQTRQVQCERSDGSMVAADLCLQYGPPMPPFSQSCRVRCTDDCQLTEWSPWSDCVQRCTGSETRRRRVHYASRGQQECSNTNIYPLVESRPCKCPLYRLVPEGTWSNCLLGSAGFAVQGSATQMAEDELECGRGIKYRPLVCLDQEDRYVNVTHCGANSDFMEEHCAIPCPRDCELSEWSDWRSCNDRMSGGIGVTTRWQKVVEDAAHGGRPCPPHNKNWIDETKKCSWHSGSREDASWQAEEWQDCDVTSISGSNAGVDCGQGVQRRTVHCTIPIDHGFRRQRTNISECDYSRKPALVQACFNYCPGQNVLSSWTEWTSCPEDCLEDTFRTRSRRIMRNPTETPSTSPALIEREKCMRGINCFTYTWNATEWSPCQLERGKICGEGVQDRLLQCLRNDERIVEVSKCEDSSVSAPSQTLSSCEVACPVDCSMTQWTDWSDCSATCGSDAVQTRYRSMLQEPNSKGRPCPSSLVQNRPCEAVPCYDWAITLWTECTPLVGDCGAGVQRRNVTCRQPNGVAVPDSFCLLTRSKVPYDKNINITLQGHEYLEREHSCEVPCPGECHHTTWSRWSVCHRTCVQGRPIGSEGIQVRSRASLTVDRDCSGDEWEPRTCSGQMCYEFDWFVGDWERDQRDVWCRRSDGLNVTGACQSEKPISMLTCSPACFINSSYCTEENRCVCDQGFTPTYSMSSGALEACIPMLDTNTDATWARSPGVSGRPGSAGELSDHIGSGITTGDSANNAGLDPHAGKGQKGKPTTTPPPATSFLASLPPWVYAIAAVVVLLIVIVAIVLCCAKCAPKKKEEEKKPEPDYSMYWDETVQKKYTGEIEL